ncbi:MAG: hypothetical protein Q7V32_18425 [Methylicorpusculum sp.]|nr:hypothetical protein [Methylicorpusculum sp.]
MSKLAERGVAIFAKACFGHPSPIKQQKNTRPLMPPAAPIRPRRLVSTQQGLKHWLSHDLTPFRYALQVFSASYENPPGATAIGD